MKILFLVFSILITSSICNAQDKPTSPTKQDPDALLPFELQQKKELTVPLEKAAVTLNLALEASKTIQNDDKLAAKVGYQVSAAVWQLTAAKQRWDDWLNEARKAHKCFDCDLSPDGFKFIRKQPTQ